MGARLFWTGGGDRSAAGSLRPGHKGFNHPLHAHEARALDENAGSAGQAGGGGLQGREQGLDGVEVAHLGCSAQRGD